MSVSLKRVLLGRPSRAERHALAWLTLASLAAAFFNSSLLFLPLLFLTLMFGWRGGVVGGGVMGLLMGLGPLVLGSVCGFLVEGFRELYQQENRLARNRQDLLKTLVHELRNPLFAARGTIDNLSSRFHELEPEDMELQLCMASSAMQSINREVDDLTQLLRLECSKLVARRKKVNLDGVFEQLRLRFPAHSLPNHVLEFQGGEVEALVDPLLVLQALDKLVANAVVHSQGGTIRVSAARTGAGHRIVVQDEGPGIPANKRREVFHRFKQMGTNSTGFGLGLYLARQYVLAQEGELTLEESEKGCRFKIWLPDTSYEDQDHYR